MQYLIMHVYPTTNPKLHDPSVQSAHVYIELLQWLALIDNLNKKLMCYFML